jgi:putrescine transport system ATP-binding protein
MTMSTRIAVMDAGQIIQVDTPTGIYEFPNSRLVAEFIGSVNLFEGKIVEQIGDEAIIAVQGGATMRMRSPLPHVTGTPVRVAIRPEKIRLATDYQEGATNQVRGVVEDIAYLGDVSIYHVRISPEQMVEMTLANVHPRAEQALTWEQEVAMEWAPTSGVVLTD